MRRTGGGGASRLNSSMTSTGTLDVSLEDLAELDDFDDVEVADRPSRPPQRSAASRRPGRQVLSLSDSVAEETLDLSASFGGLDITGEEVVRSGGSSTSSSPFSGSHSADLSASGMNLGEFEPALPPDMTDVSSPRSPPPAGTSLSGSALPLQHENQSSPVGDSDGHAIQELEELEDDYIDDDFDASSDDEPAIQRKNPANDFDTSRDDEPAPELMRLGTDASTIGLRSPPGPPPAAAQSQGLEATDVRHGRLHLGITEREPSTQSVQARAAVLDMEAEAISEAGERERAKARMEAERKAKREAAKRAADEASQREAAGRPATLSVQGHAVSPRREPSSDLETARAQLQAADEAAFRAERRAQAATSELMDARAEIERLKRELDAERRSALSREEASASAATVRASASVEAAAREHERQLEAMRKLHEQTLNALREQHAAAMEAQRESLQTQAEAARRLGESDALVRAKQAEEALASSRTLHEAELAAQKALAERLAAQRAQQAEEMLNMERERAKQEMAQAKALLESALASRDRTHVEAVAAVKRQAEEELEHSRALLDERLASIEREHEAAREADKRLQQAEMAQFKELTEATVAARERQHAEQLKQVNALHQEQLNAYHRIEQQGGTLQSLAMEVGNTVQGLSVLRERMEQDLWKTVLKGEAAMLEKESALNAIQHQREKLWAQREALVTSMQQELGAEQERMAQAWKNATTEWESLKDEHNEFRSQLAQRAIDIDSIQQRVASEMADAVNQLQAERQLIAQERNLCRDERSALSRSLIEHRSDITKQRDKIFTTMEELAAQKERVVHSSTLESVKLDQQKRAAELLFKNSKLERAVAAKERAAISGLMAAFQQDREEFNTETERLREANEAVETRAREVEAERSEAQRHKTQAEALAQQTAEQARRLEEQQKQLKAQAAELLKSSAVARDINPFRTASFEHGSGEGAWSRDSSLGGTERVPPPSAAYASYTARALNAFPLSTSSQNGDRRRAQIAETLAHLNARLGGTQIPLGASMSNPTAPNPVALPHESPPTRFAECMDHATRPASAPAVNFVAEPAA